MFTRKAIVALCVSILAVAGLNLYDPVPKADGGLAMGIFVYSLYAVPVIFIYGITASLISETISRKANKYNETLSLGLHLLFGFGFLIPYSLLFETSPFPEFTIFHVLTHPITIFSIGSALLFYIIDFFLKRDSAKKLDRVSK